MKHTLLFRGSGEEQGDALHDWHPIVTAPHDRDLHLSVIEDGEVYALVFPCRRKGNCQWTHAVTGRLIDVDPTHWRDWTE